MFLRSATVSQCHSGGHSVKRRQDPSAGGDAPWWSVNNPPGCPVAIVSAGSVSQSSRGLFDDPPACPVSDRPKRFFFIRRDDLSLILKDVSSLILGRFRQGSSGAR